MEVQPTGAPQYRKLSDWTENARINLHNIGEQINHLGRFLNNQMQHESNFERTTFEFVEELFVIQSSFQKLKFAQKSFGTNVVKSFSTRYE